MPVYEKEGVTLTLSCEKQSDSGLIVTLTASNTTDSDISSFTLQAAVPKVCLTACDKTHFVHLVNHPQRNSLASFLCRHWFLAASVCEKKQQLVAEYIFFVLSHFQCCITHTDTLLHLLPLYICVACRVSVLDPVMFSGISAVNGPEQQACVVVL